MHDLGVFNFYVELIEHFSCNDTYELGAREGYFIREYGTLNKQIAGRTPKQWYEYYSELVSENRKEYRHNNLE